MIGVKTVNPTIKKSKFSNQKAKFNHRKSQVNHPAIVGFLLPFMAAGAASACVLFGSGNLASFFSRAVFFALVPLILASGLYASLRSIPLIPEKGDKDYAYSGLVLNVFFILFYLSSLIYALLRFGL